MVAMTKGAGPRRKELLVAVAQWLAEPGRPDVNLLAATAWIERAGAAGADLVVLPELWPSGYDTASLRGDVAASAQPVPGPRTRALGALARDLRMWVFAGSLPEVHEGRIYNTAVVFDRQGALVAQHRKVHLYPPTGEDMIFTAGDTLTSFADSGSAAWASPCASMGTSPRWPALWRVGEWTWWSSPMPTSGKPGRTGIWPTLLPPSRTGSGGCWRISAARRTRAHFSARVG